MPSVLLSDASGDAMPRRIIESTLSLVGETGLENLTIKKISDHAGISVGIVHHHFQNKHNLVYCTYEYLIDHVRHQMVSARKEIDDPIERIRETVRICFDPKLVTKGTASVWPQLWGSSVYDPAVKRLLSAYSVRFISNMAYDFRQVFHDRGMARAQALTVSSLIHGLWVEHRVCGNASLPECFAILNAYIDSVSGQLWKTYMAQAAQTELKG